MNKNYFRYLFRTYRILIIFFLAMYLCLSLLWNLFSVPDTPGIGFYRSVNAAMVLSTGLTFVLPVLLFSFAHKRREADLIFALPMSRKELRLTSAAFAFAVAFGYWLITACIAWVLNALSLYSFLSFLMLAGYAAMMLIGLTVIHSFIYLIANSTTDGLVLLCAYTLFPFAAFMAEIGIFEQMIAGYSLGQTPVSLLLSPILCLWRNYTALLSQNGWLYQNFSLLHFGLSLGCILLEIGRAHV